MRKKIVVWSQKAKDNLLEIRRLIAQDSPKTAQKFIKRLKASTIRLGLFPESGWIVEEFDIPIIREILFGDYRIVYRYDGTRIEILKVHHGAQRLGKDIFG